MDTVSLPPSPSTTPLLQSPRIPFAAMSPLPRTDNTSVSPNQALSGVPTLSFADCGALSPISDHMAPFPANSCPTHPAPSLFFKPGKAPPSLHEFDFFHPDPSSMGQPVSSSTPVASLQSVRKARHPNQAGPEIFDVTIGPDNKRRYVCKHEGCDRSFSTSGHLTRHFKIHTGEKMHVCPILTCPAKFSRKDNMQQHFTTHQKKVLMNGEQLVLKPIDPASLPLSVNPTATIAALNMAGQYSATTSPRFPSTPYSRPASTPARPSLAPPNPRDAGRVPRQVTRPPSLLMNRQPGIDSRMSTARPRTALPRMPHDILSPIPSPNDQTSHPHANLKWQPPVAQQFCTSQAKHLPARKFNSLPDLAMQACMTGPRPILTSQSPVERIPSAGPGQSLTPHAMVSHPHDRDLSYLGRPASAPAQDHSYSSPGVFYHTIPDEPHYHDQEPFYTNPAYSQMKDKAPDYVQQGYKHGHYLGDYLSPIDTQAQGMAFHDYGEYEFEHAQ
ncbi:hypothetical protein HDU91_001548, partial [Kappamyces sp. JEL0680]